MSQNKTKSTLPENLSEHDRVLVDIAVNDEDIGVKCNAVKKIRSQDVLIWFAWNEELGFDLQAKAVCKITNQNALKAIAKARLGDASMMAIQRIEDQEFLSKIASNKELSIYYRNAAIWHLHQDKIEILRQIAEDENDGEGVRREALSRIFDMKVRVKVIKKCESERVSELGIIDLDDQTALIDIASDTTISQYKRLKAIKKINEGTSEALFTIAESDENDSVALAAFNQMDRSIVSKYGEERERFEKRVNFLAKNAKAKEVRLNAIKRVRDLAVLEEILKNDTDPLIRSTTNDVYWEAKKEKEKLIARAKSSDYFEPFGAIEKVDDQETLLWCVFNHSDPNKQRLAVKRLKSQEDLSLVVTSFDQKVSDSIRAEAANKIEDEDVCVEFDQKVSDSIRAEAANKIEDEDVCVELLKKIQFRPYPITCRALIEGIKDQDKLLGIATNKEEYEDFTRMIAVGRIANQKELIEFAMRDDNILVREAAIRRIEDDEFLFELVCNDLEHFESRDCRGSDYVFKVAMEQISDKEKLTKIALNHPNYNVRRLAAEQLGIL